MSGWFNSLVLSPVHLFQILFNILFYVLLIFIRVYIHICVVFFINKKYVRNLLILIFFYIPLYTLDYIILLHMSLLWVSRCLFLSLAVSLLVCARFSLFPWVKWSVSNTPPPVTHKIPTPPPPPRTMLGGVIVKHDPTWVTRYITGALSQMSIVRKDSILLIGSYSNRQRRHIITVFYSNR